MDQVCKVVINTIVKWTCNNKFSLKFFRYFTGHTKNPDGTAQFIKGKTSVKEAFNGAIKILTVAVCFVRMIIRK